MIYTLESTVPEVLNITSNLLENNSVIIETIWVHYHFTYKQYCTIKNELMVVSAYIFSANIEKIFLYHINLINTIDSVDVEHYKKYIFTSWDQLYILLCFKVSVQKPTLKNICGLFDWPYVIETKATALFVKTVSGEFKHSIKFYLSQQGKEIRTVRAYLHSGAYRSTRNTLCVVNRAR